MRSIEVTLRSLEVTFEAPRGLGNTALLLLRPFVDVECGAQPGVAAYLPWWAAVRDTGSLASRTNGGLEFRRQQEQAKRGGKRRALSLKAQCNNGLYKNLLKN